MILCLTVAGLLRKDLLEKARFRLGFMGYVRFQEGKIKGQRLSRSVE